MIKYSFILPYYRRPQFYNTLLTFVHWYAHRQDYEIVILEDTKNMASAEDHQQLLKILTTFQHLPITYRLMNNQNYSCPCATINEGVDIAKGEYVIMSNPECAHITNVLKGFDEELMIQPQGIYLVASCQAVTCNSLYVETYEDFCKNYTTGNWYQKSDTPANGCLNWCTCISKEDYIRSGGFNEEYDKGIGRADAAFAETMRRMYHVMPLDNLVVVHQMHDISYPEDRKHELVAINRSCRIFRSRFFRSIG